MKQMTQHKKGTAKKGKCIIHWTIGILTTLIELARLIINKIEIKQYKD